VVLLSGGIDSFACAHFLRSNEFEVSTVFIDFGQGAAEQEHAATARISKLLDVERRVVRIHLEAGGVFGAGEIPARNLVLLTAATMFTAGPRVIALGIHAGTQYFDCSAAFVAEIDRLLSECTNGAVSVVAPVSPLDEAGYCCLRTIRGPESRRDVQLRTRESSTLWHLPLL
jgi:7-cyano-7-deazaguanine synthase